MYKVEIDWDFRSPTLRVLTGQVRIGRIDMGALNEGEFPSFPVKKERHTLGYEQCPAIFDRTKPVVDMMVRAYYDGMIMRNQSVYWFQDCSKHNNYINVTMLD